MGEEPRDERYVLTVLKDGVEVGDATIETYHDSVGECGVAVTLAGRRYQAAADDYFDALAAVRRRVEVSGLRLVCYGASLACYPSPMSRVMGEGVRVYRLTLGEPAKLDTLVNMFASGPDVQPASVEEQEAFYRNWLASLRQPPN